MKKIFTLRRWQTLSQAAQYLSSAFNEEVSEADILHLSLDFAPNTIKISVIFTDDTLASRCKRIEDEAAVEYLEVPSLNRDGIVKLPIGGQIVYEPAGHMLQVQDDVFFLEDNYPYDLAMFGGERANIETRYWEIMGGAMAESTNLDGTFVLDGKNTFQLKNALRAEKGERVSYFPAGGLPEHSVLVVRTDALTEFVQSMVSTNAKSFATTERNTLLVMIAALCKRAEIDHLGSKAASDIVRIVDSLNNGASVSDDTARKVLRQIPDALSARGK